MHLGVDLSPVAAAGNLTADFCREKGSEAFQRGVRLHRRIDSFTDSHAEVIQARPLFTGKLRRFSSVLVDLVFDLCLSRTWSQWCPDEPRLDFIDRHLASFLQVSDQIPAPASLVIHAMQKGRWMHAYDDISGIEATISRIVHRRPKFAPMLDAAPVIAERYEDLHRQFLRFYPHLLVTMRS